MEVDPVGTLGTQVGGDKSGDAYDIHWVFPRPVSPLEQKLNKIKGNNWYANHRTKSFAFSLLN